MLSLGAVEQKLKIILSQASVEVAYTIRRVTPGLIMNVGAEDSVGNPGDCELENEPVHLLRILYGECPHDIQSQFPQLMLERLTEQTAQVIAHTMVELRTLPILVQKLADRETDKKGRAQAWRALAQKLANESHLFTEEDLEVLARAQGEETRHQSGYQSWGAGGLSVDPDLSDLKLLFDIPTVGRLIDKIRYRRLRTELLEGHNPEINSDRQELMSRMETLGFRVDIMTALRDVERKIASAGTSIDLKGCMDLLRTVYEEIVEDAAKAVAAKIGRPLPPPERDFQPWNQLLVGTQVLTEDEGVLSQKLYNYLSNAGTHRLGSAPEQVRVSRNMVIELGLLILGRVQTLGRT